MVMKQSSKPAILASSISQQLSLPLSRICLPFENLLVAWSLLTPIASFYFRYPLDKSLITFDRAVACGLVVLLFGKFWQAQRQAKEERDIEAPSRLRFSLTRFELAWLLLSTVALLNALWQSTNVNYALRIAIDSFLLPLIFFHIAKHHCDWRGRETLVLRASLALALFLFATGIYEFFTGANLFPYKGSTVFRDGELRVNGPFASDSSYAIICLLVTLFLRLLPRLLQIRFDKSARLIYVVALAASAVATLLPLFRTVAFALVVCWLAIEYFIQATHFIKTRSATPEAPQAEPEIIGKLWFKRLAFPHPKRTAAFMAIALLFLISLAAWMEIGGSHSFLRRLASPRNFYGRIATWQTAARIALENPIAGVGLTNYSDYFDVIYSDWQHQDVDWVGDIRAIETPHSNFLWIGAELGLTGLVPYLAALACLWLMGARACKRAGNRQQLLAGGGLLALLAAYTIPGLTLQSGFYWDLNLYFFFMTGLLANLFSEHPQ